MPVIGFVSGGSAVASVGATASFRKGLGETGYVDGQNLTIEYHWLEGQYDRLPALQVRGGLQRIVLEGSMNGSVRKAATPRRWSAPRPNERRLVTQHPRRSILSPPG
jgi:hypothetical protein